MKSFNNYINGKEVSAQDGRTTPIIDPVTGKQYATAALSGPADVDAAMKAAADAFDSWKNSTPSMRQRAINDIADVMEANMNELIETEIENTGKPRAITFSEEVPPMMDQIRFFAGAARMLEGKSAGEYMSGFTS
jgi:betaine-aldehyde dehydrogenase